MVRARIASTTSAPAREVYRAATGEAPDDRVCYAGRGLAATS
jgi:hypothetical protein